MLEWSKETASIDAAIVKMQAELPAAPKNKTNPHFKSKYADFQSCKETATPVLAKHGLAVIQTPMADVAAGSVSVQSRLIHISGEWYQGVVACVPRDLSPQSVGAATTYLKRQGYCALTGLVADEDDDGNQQQQQKKPQPPRRFPAYDKTNDAMRKWLCNKFRDKKWPNDTWQALSDLYVGRDLSDDEFTKFAKEQE